MDKELNSSESKGAKGLQRPFNSAESFSEKIQDKLSDNTEGKLTKSIEAETSKVPSGVFLALAGASMAISAAFAVTSKRKELANFVGLWAPSILILGLYNKIVKTQGSDRESHAI